MVRSRDTSSEHSSVEVSHDIGASAHAVPPPPLSPSRQRCTALYDFVGESEGELSFCAGDQINITNQISADWAEGEIFGRRGMFPMNYVQMV